MRKIRYIQEYKRYTMIMKKWRENSDIETSFADFLSKVRNSKKFSEFEYTEDRVNFLIIVTSSDISLLSPPHID